MSVSELQYIQNNRKWLDAKSILNYIQLGISALVVVGLAYASLVGATVLATEIRGFEQSEAVKKIVITFFGSFAIGLIIMILIEMAILYVTAIQYKKLGGLTSTLTDKNQSQVSDSIIKEYFAFFKTIGLLNIVSFVLSIFIVGFWIVALIASFSTSGLDFEKFRSSSSSSSSQSTKTFQY